MPALFGEMMVENNEAALTLAAKNISDILSLAFNVNQSTPTLVVFDLKSPLACLLSLAYQRCLPLARTIHFDEVTPEFIIEQLQAMPPGSLVVLIQSTNFRLNAFRVRVELFNQQLKVIEHPHLERMVGDEVQYYLDSLAYDAPYFRETGQFLKQQLDHATRGVIESQGVSLVFEGGFESAKLNVGDYSNMKNVGGQFPIGEVFTEAKDLEAVNGCVAIAAFGDTTFSVNQLKTPIILIIEKGQVVDVKHTTLEFDRVLNNIIADEGVVWVRELGFGLNRAFTKERIVTDIGTYERMCGVHLSLGAKHSMYRKPQFTRSTARHHVDVFVATDRVLLDDALVYEGGRWVV